MRKNNINLRILFFILQSIVMIKTNAQTGLNFQGVARTSNNVILASQAITIKLSILQGSATGTADYIETRKVTTNAQGLFTAVIGDTGAISTLGNFTTINWKLSPKFLKIEMDAAAGTNFITMGTTQFQYVAYAQFAKSVDAENIIGIVPVTLGGTGVNSLTGLKTALTLNNVNNTLDLNKPISTLTQTALDLKLNATDTSKYTKQTYSDSALLTKLKISDTATMLSSRIARDTLNLSNRINLKINTTDVTSGLDLKLNKADTIKYTKQTYSDSALLTKLKLSDTASMLSNRIGKDTLNLSARINLKANMSDLTTGLALKLNATDTSKYTKQTYTDSALLTKLSITENAASATTATTAGIASTATKLATARNINGVAFDGSGDITVIVDAGTLTGTSLNSTISSSSLTSVGTITSGIWSGTTIAINKGGTGLTETGTSGQLLTSTGAGTLTWTTPLSTSNFVPYSGATGIVNLGSYDLTVNSLTVGKGSGNQTHNTANGVQSLLRNTTGQDNTAIGYNTLFRNTTGLVNTATGAFALYINTTGQANTAAGVSALSSNTVGSYNTADGYFSLYSNTAGLSNTAVGQRSLYNNLTGSYNTAIGDGALNLNAYGNHNTAIGYGANVNVNNLENATAIGDGAIVSTSNTMQLGNTNVTNVNTSGTITAGGVTYPNIDGTSGQILTSTGAGTLTWTTPSTTATKLTTARKINNVDFDGSGDITVTADAGTLTGTTIKSTVTGSSLTSVGTLTSATVNGKVIVGASTEASTSAVLEVNSTNQGFLPPRVYAAQRDAIVSPVAGLTIWCINCGQYGELNVYNGVAWVNMLGFSSSSVPSISIGQNYYGGKIAYILAPEDPGYDPNTPHGLVAATEDQSTGIQWFNGFYTTTGATGIAIGAGLSNTNTIIASQGAIATTYAAGLARAYTGGGYTDWYLPSKDELNKLYINRVAIGGFANSYYWSSSEDYFLYAWIQNFTNGFRSNNAKHNTFYVRAIRAF